MKKKGCEEMTEKDLTDRVIEILGLTEYHYKTISGYVYDGIDYLKNAGVPDSVIHSKQSIGVLVQYVNDTWTLTQGQSKLSPFFNERVRQLSLCDGDEDV